MKEVWKTIEGFSRYEVSNLGRFRKKGFKKIQRGTPNDRGYLVVHLTDDDGRDRMMTVHRMVATAFVPNPENKPVIDHINAVPADNRAENLRWFTYKENATLNRKTNIKKMQKKIRFSHDRISVSREGEEHYFSSVSDAAKFIGCKPLTVSRTLRQEFGKSSAMGWNITEVSYDNERNDE